MRLGGGGGVTVSDSILGGHKTLFLPNSLNIILKILRGGGGGARASPCTPGSAVPGRKDRLCCRIFSQTIGAITWKHSCDCFKRSLHQKRLDRSHRTVFYPCVPIASQKVLQLRRSLHQRRLYGNQATIYT